jgi:hypothetical protein
LPFDSECAWNTIDGVSTWNSPLPTTAQEVDWGDYTEVIITLASPIGSLAQGFLQTQIQQR